MSAPRTRGKNWRKRTDTHSGQRRKETDGEHRRRARATNARREVSAVESHAIVFADLRVCGFARGSAGPSSRDQYARVVSTFIHTSYPIAPDLCLARFDERKSIGVDAFTKKHDPYRDIPLNENPPLPVIDLPGLTPAGEEGRFKLDETGGKRRQKGRSRK